MRFLAPSAYWRLASQPQPPQPYPSQYDEAAGKAGVAAGAYMYSVPNHEPQHSQDQQHLRRQQLRQQQQTAAAAKPAGPLKGGDTGGKPMGRPLVATCAPAYGDRRDDNNVVGGGSSGGGGGGGGVRVSGGSSGQSLFPSWSNSAGAAACAPGW